MKLAFYKAPGTTLDRLIRAVTHGPYSHAELVFSDGMWFSSSPRDGGVRFKRIQPLPDNWDFFDVPVAATTEATVRKWCRDEVGCGYDWIGVTRFVVPFLQPSRGRWFCSEICVAALQQCGHLSGLRPSRVSPSGLWSICHSDRPDFG